jgi:hypothetical protein
MSDDLDDLLRVAMKTLDAEVPSGYFEDLPNRTLARLENSSMQTTGTSGSERDPSSGAPPQADRDEDSGLHDIRSLASSTKARLSSRRSTQGPVVDDDDVLSSSSAGWKAVALPEPAKMVSLPALAELPSKRDVKEKDKAAKKARDAKEAEDQAAVGATASAPVAAPAAELPASIAPAKAAPAVTSISSRIAPNKQAGGRGKTIALIAVGLAAAAGGVLYFAMGTKSASKDHVAFEAKPLAPLPTMTAPTIEKVPAPVAVAAVEPAPAAQVEPVPPPAPEPDVKAVAAKGAVDKEKVHKVEIRDTPKAAKPDVAKPAPVKDDKKNKDPDAGDPSFDQLLKEAGVSDQKKENKPALEKKSLSGSDFKNGMGAISGKAQGCFAGTQGTAAVKLTVAPSGQVSKVSVSGVFAGSPVGSCVESAVKGASFPPWDGGPQTFSYSFLLSD